MADPIVNKIGELCTSLSGYVQSRAARIAAVATEPYRHRLSAGREVADLFEYQVFLGEELSARYAELVAWDDRLAEERRRLGELRGQRDRLAEDLRSRLRQVVDALRASFPADAARYLCRPAVPLPKGALALLEAAQRFRAALTDPELEAPPPFPGVEVDLPEVGRSFGEPMEGLGETLAAIPGCESAASHARARKQEALEELRSFTGKMTRFLEALADVAGDDRLASRVRRSLTGRR